MGRHVRTTKGVWPRWLVPSVVVAGILAAAMWWLMLDQERSLAEASDDRRLGRSSSAPLPTTKTPSASPVTPAPLPPLDPTPRPSSNTTPPNPPAPTSLVRLGRITGDISPKSVGSNGLGLVFAQNMMYRHTVTVYDEDFSLVRTIPDSVDLGKLGIKGFPGTSQGAPVEVAFSPDGAKAYVSNYSMYGSKHGPEGHDNCAPGSSATDSFIYRIDAASLEIDQAIKVGQVPKHLAVSPDGRTLVVSNWCSYSASIVDLAKGKEVRQVPLGPYPRGVAFSPDSKTAYVTIMSRGTIAQIDVASGALTYTPRVGGGARHVNVSKDGRHLFVTCNGSGYVAKYDTRSGAVVRTVATGKNPRSAALSADGKVLYVVNYESDTISVLTTKNLAVVQTIAVDHHPIGITYDAKRARVWVATYGGSIEVFGTP